ncbi:MAG: RsbRD N-terminal domain-containing protein [Pseudomonadota bacterium]|nr:RsbRD N-terminal domain-containing protein [Pseudomonadota bacterium]
MDNSPEHSRIACSRLADWLQLNSRALVSEWVVQVRQDAKVPSETLTNPEIIDHVPQILEEINEALRHACGTTPEVQQVTARHTIVRWAQGYDLNAVIREVSLLRTVLILQSRAFEQQYREIGNEGLVFASTIVNRILDDVVMDATDTFLKLKERAQGNES